MVKMKAVKVALIMLCLSITAFGQDKQEWTLQECIDYALEHNLNVKMSILDAENQKINVEQSRWARYPDANANGSYNFSWGRSIDPTTNLFVDNQRIVSANGQLSSNVTLFSGFGLMNSVKQNQLALMAGEESLKVSKNTVIFNVITFYTNVMFAEELLENSRSQLLSTEQQVEQTRKRVDAGALPHANLLDLLAQKASNEVNLVNRENDYTMARIQLKQALQLPPEAEITIVVPDLNIEVQPVMEQSAIEIYNIAQNTMPEVQGAKLSTQSAKMGVTVAKGNLYPTLSLSGGIQTRYSDVADGPRFIPDGGEPIIFDPNPVIGFVDGTGTVVRSNSPSLVPSGEFVDGYSFSNQIDDNLSKYVGLNLRIPVFNGFSARAGIQRAVISYERSKINETDVNYQLWQTIEQAYTDVVAAGKSYYASNLQVEAREESFRVMKQRFDAGSVNFTDYQIAENDLFQARSDLLRAKYDYVFKMKVLDFYQGKPLEF